MALTSSQQELLDRLLTAYQNGKKLSELPLATNLQDLAAITIEILDSGVSKRMTIAELLTYIKDNATEAADKANAAAETATAAAQEATAAGERIEATRLVMEEIIARAEVVVAGVPTGLEVTAPAEVTLGNTAKQYITPTVKPDSVAQNVIYQVRGTAATVEPDGEIVAAEAGTVLVHVIPTEGTKYYKTVTIKVVKPRMRLAAAGAMRFDAAGNIRLT